MFNRLTNLIWGDYNQKQINTLRPIVNKINERYDKFDSLSDDEIKAKTPEFKERLNKWETIDDILPEAFAVVKQACKRMVWDTYDVKWEKQTWNMIPYDVQLLWGIILHQGKIAEMKTWEWLLLWPPPTITKTMTIILKAMHPVGRSQLFYGFTEIVVCAAQEQWW